MRLFLILCILASTFGADAQKRNPKKFPTPKPAEDIFNSKFVPRVITYNASDNPNECWEAVAHGIEVDMGNGKKGFFEMPRKAIEELKTIIGDKEVVIFVGFYSEPDTGSHAIGNVEQITLEMGGKTLYDHMDGNNNVGSKE